VVARKALGHDAYRVSPPNEQTPFWMDDPDPYAAVGAGVTPGRGRFGGLGLGTLVRLTMPLVLLIGLAVRYPLVWLVVIVQGTVLFAGLYGVRQRRGTSEQTAAVQQRAKELTGAAVIGSAIHTAGHPLLRRDQRVVLALRGASLTVYDYASPQPIHTIDVADLTSVDLVVYDDDDVPHVGTIDQSARALQLSFRWQSGTCTCQFRWMFPVRPIDWYHSIEQTRLKRA